MCGRTGTRVGAAFIDGLEAEYAALDKRKDHAFTLRRNTFFVPGEKRERERVRAVAFDLDSKTVDEAGIADRIMGTLDYTGGGAEMLWPEGYQEAQKLEREIEGVLDAAGAPAARNFILFHNTCGGTGSGLGSFVVDLLRRKYATPGSARNLVTVTVLPSGEEKTGDYRGEYEEVSAASHYNSILTLNTLRGVRPGGPRPSENLRTVSLVMDNPTVARTIEARTGRAPDGGTMDEVNAVMARVALGFTATLRYGPTDLGNVLVHLRQQRQSPVVVPALAPLTPSDSKRSLYDLTYEALRDNALSAAGLDDIKQLYMLFRGRDISRPEVRHVHDLLEAVYKTDAPLYTLVEPTTPKYEREVLAFLQTSATTRVFQTLTTRMRRNIAAGASVHDFEAWGVDATALQQNLMAFERSLSGTRGEHHLRRL